MNKLTKLFLSCLIVSGLLISGVTIAQQSQQQPNLQLKKPLKPKKPSSRSSGSSSTTIPGNQHDLQVAILGIVTDATGAIRELSVRHQNRIQFVRGCNAKLADLPHLLLHYQLGRTVFLSTNPNGCLSKVWTKK